MGLIAGLPHLFLSVSVSFTPRPSTLSLISDLSYQLSHRTAPHPITPRPPLAWSSQTLATDEHSNVLIYMNGHGGDQFLKFHDMEEVSSHDLGGALREMELKKRYHRVRACVHVCVFVRLSV